MARRRLSVTQDAQSRLLLVIDRPHSCVEIGTPQIAAAKSGQLRAEESRDGGALAPERRGPGAECAAGATPREMNPFARSGSWQARHLPRRRRKTPPGW